MPKIEDDGPDIEETVTEVEVTAEIPQQLKPVDSLLTDNQHRVNEAKAEGKLRKFKLLRGVHCQSNPQKPEEQQTFTAGQVVKSRSDLVKLFGAERFSLLD